MANVKEEKLRKLKKSYVVGSMVGFITIGVIVFAIFVAMLTLFGLYIMDSKLRDEYSRAKNMAELYRMSEESGNEQVLAALNDQGNDYIIIP